MFCLFECWLFPGERIAPHISWNTKLIDRTVLRHVYIVLKVVMCVVWPFEIGVSKNVEALASSLDYLESVTVMLCDKKKAVHGSST